MKLVASMIARDELGRYQPRLAQHLLGWVDEIRVLDDGSTDGTGVELERVDPARVHVMRNKRSRWEREGEGIARQQLLEWTLASGGDWVISIDADEVVPEGAKLREFLDAKPKEVESVSVRMVEVWSTRVGPTHVCVSENEALPDPETFRPKWGIRVDGGWAPRNCPIVWRAPSRRMTVGDAWKAGWTIPGRALACGREPERVRVLDWASSGVDICHLGWSNPDERQARYERYVAIDGGEFHASDHIRSIMETPTLEAYPGPSLLL